MDSDFYRKWFSGFAEGIEKLNDKSKAVFYHAVQKNVQTPALFKSTKMYSGKQAVTETVFIQSLKSQALHTQKFLYPAKNI